DKKSELTADVHELSLQSAFDPSRTRYSGTLSYRDSHVKWQNASPVVHNLDARFAATPDEFTLENAVLRTHSSHVSVSATARDYSQPRIHATLEALLDTAEFRRALKNPSLPVGAIHASGILDYNSEPGRPFLDLARVAGEVHSARLAVPYKQTFANIVGLDARYALMNGNASVTGIRAQLLGGRVSGTLQMRNLSGDT